MCQAFVRVEGITGFLLEKSKGRIHLGVPRVVGKLILKANLMNWDVGAWNGLI
jgi:hypothetical protein